MPTVPILMPQLGESIAEATVVRLGVAAGDAVRADQEIIEVETNKAVMSVTTLCDGVIAEIKAKEGVSYSVGTTLGLLEVTEEEVARTGVDTLESVEQKRAEAVESQHPAQGEANLHFALDADDAYEEAAREFSEEELVKLTLLIVAINGWNRFAVGFRMVHPT